MTREQIILRNEKLGAKPSNGWADRATRQVNIDMFKVNDIITFDDVDENGKMKVYDTFFGPPAKVKEQWAKYKENPEGEVQPAKFTYVTVKRGGVTLTMQFFPGTFTKSRWEVNSAGQRIADEPKTATGTACDQYMSYASEADAMNSFVNKSVKVTRDDTITCRNFADTQNVKAHILGLDLVIED